MCLIISFVINYAMALLVAGLGSTTLGAESPAPSITATAKIPWKFDRGPIPVWSGGAFLVVDYAQSSSPVFRTFDKSGSPVSDITFSILGANHIRTYTNSFARSFEGTFATVGWASDDT